MPGDKRDKYLTPLAFRQAFESRLRKRAAERGVPFQRTQFVFVIERFMARLAREFGDDLIFKGGIALELRLSAARATKDLDVRLRMLPEEAVLVRVQAAGRLALGDNFRFDVALDRAHPAIAGAGVRYQGTRYRVTPRFAAKRYGGVFGLDVAVGDPVLAPVDTVRSSEVLAFAGIASEVFRLYPRETHLAEKLHAYTLPRAGQLNSRIKDLPDLALLARTGVFEGSRLLKAVEQTFGHRGTHAVPARLPEPPDAWRVGYAEMAEEYGLPWRTLADVFEAASTFVDGGLEGRGTWLPDVWAWA